MRKAPDETEGPLLRIRILTIAQTIDRATGEWIDSFAWPEQQITTVKSGDILHYMPAQPVFDLRSLPYRTIEQLLKKGKESP